MKLQSCLLLTVLGINAAITNAADLTPEQLEQQIQLSHMLGQISQQEQNYRIQKVRSLGVDGYYKWLQADNRSTEKNSTSNRSR